MLTTLCEMPRHHVADRHGMQGVARKKRFAPIAHGKLTLATFEVSQTEYRMTAWRDTGRSVSVGVHVRIAEGKQKGRHFWVNFMMSGNIGRKNWTDQQLRSMLDCDRVADPYRGYPSIERMVEMIDGRTYPCEIVQEKHWQTGATVNNTLALSPDPAHWAWESYHELVKRLGDKVPGVELYPESPSAALVAKRARDAVEVREDGLTLAQRRSRQGRKRSAAIRAAQPQLQMLSLLEAG